MGKASPTTVSYLGTAGKSGLSEKAFRHLGIKACDLLMAQIGASEILSTFRQSLGAVKIDGRKLSQMEEELLIEPLSEIKTIEVEGRDLVVEIAEDRQYYDFRLLEAETGLCLVYNIKIVRASSPVNITGPIGLVRLMAGSQALAVDTPLTVFKRTWVDGTDLVDLTVRDYFLCVVGADLQVRALPLLAMQGDQLVANAHNWIQARAMHEPQQHVLELDRSMIDSLQILAEQIGQVKLKKMHQVFTIGDEPDLFRRVHKELSTLPLRAQQMLSELGHEPLLPIQLALC